MKVAFGQDEQYPVYYLSTCSGSYCYKIDIPEEKVEEFKRLEKEWEDIHKYIYQEAEKQGAFKTYEKTYKQLGEI